MKLAEVRELVLWWDANVGDQGAHIRNSEHDGRLSVERAVEICEFTAPRIAEWRTRLARDGYAAARARSRSFGRW